MKCSHTFDELGRRLVIYLPPPCFRTTLRVSPMVFPLPPLCSAFNSTYFIFILKHLRDLLSGVIVARHELIMKLVAKSFNNRMLLIHYCSPTADYCRRRGDRQADRQTGRQTGWQADRQVWGPDTPCFSCHTGERDPVPLQRT